MPELLGIEYEGMPLGPAAGAINGTNKERIWSQLVDIANSPAGLAYFGSIGTRYNEGNRGNTYAHDPTTGETVNSMGLPEIGIDDAEPIVREAAKLFTDKGKVFIGSVTPLAGERADQVLPVLVERMFAAGAPVVEVNYSCPNIVTSDGGRKPIIGYDPEAMHITRTAITERVGRDQKIVEKLPPYIGEFRAIIPEVTKTYRGSNIGVAAVCGFNTEPNVILRRNGTPLLRIIATVDGEEVITHAGGRSGPAMANIMYRAQQELGAKLPNKIAFIAANGINTGDEVYRRVHEGVCKAVAAVSVTPYFEGEKAGRSYGSTATKMAMEYSSLLSDNS